MIHYNWDFTVLLLFKHEILQGIFYTLSLAFLTIILGTLFGVIFAILRFYGIKVIRILTAIFIEFFMAIPLLILIIWIYFILPIYQINLSSFEAALLGFTLSMTAFIAEIIRSGFDTFPKEQFQAGITLGMKKTEIIHMIILPYVFQKMKPAIIAQYITAIKLTTIASVISVNELLYVSQNIISYNYKPLEVYTVVGIFYIMLIFPLSLYLKQISRN